MNASIPNKKLKYSCLQSSITSATPNDTHASTHVHPKMTTLENKNKPHEHPLSPKQHKLDPPTEEDIKLLERIVAEFVARKEFYPKETTWKRFPFDEVDFYSILMTDEQHRLMLFPKTPLTNQYGISFTNSETRESVFERCSNEAEIVAAIKNKCLPQLEKHVRNEIPFIEMDFRKVKARVENVAVKEMTGTYKFEWIETVKDKCETLNAYNADAKITLSFTVTARKPVIFCVKELSLSKSLLCATATNARALHMGTRRLYLLAKECAGFQSVGEFR